MRALFILQYGEICIVELSWFGYPVDMYQIMYHKSDRYLSSLAKLCIILYRICGAWAQGQRYICETVMMS